MKQRLHAVLLFMIVAVILYATISRAGRTLDECTREWNNATESTPNESLTMRDTQ